MHAGTARHAGAFHTECMQRPPSEGPHAPCPRRAGGTAPSAHLAIQPIPCNKRQHLTELRTSPSLLLLRLRPALPRLRLLLALLPALGPCQRAQPQAGLQEAGLSFKEQRAAAKKPPPSTPHLQPGCRSWATKTQPQGRRVEGGKARGGSWPELQGAATSSPGWRPAPLQLHQSASSNSKGCRTVLHPLLLQSRYQDATAPRTEPPPGSTVTAGGPGGESPGVPQTPSKGGEKDKLSTPCFKKHFIYSIVHFHPR